RSVLRGLICFYGTAQVARKGGVTVMEAWLSHGLACRFKIDIGVRFLVKAERDFRGRGRHMRESENGRGPSNVLHMSSV
ncbi:hypothetical protein PanWU01x14_025230, partial [Parasponia andersonii]